MARGADGAGITTGAPLMVERLILGGSRGKGGHNGSASWARVCGVARYRTALEDRMRGLMGGCRSGMDWEESREESENQTLVL